MRAIFTSIAALGLLCSTLLGCSKESKNEQPAVVKQAQVDGNRLLETPLLRKLPTGTVGFLVSDLSGEGYQKFKSSPWYNDMPFDQALSEIKKAGVDSEQQKMLETVIQLFKNLGTISPEGRSLVDQVLSSVVLLATRLPGERGEIGLGAYASAAGQTILREKLPALRDGLKEMGASIQDTEIAGATGFAATIPRPGSDSEDSNAKAAGLRVYVGASDKLLGVSLSKVLVDNLFSTTEANDIERIKGLPEFQKVEREVRGAELPLAFSFVSTKALLPYLETALTSGADAAPGASSAAPSSTNPLEAIGFSQGINQGIATRAAAAVDPKTDTQKRIFDALSGGTLPSSASAIPADTAFALTVDTKGIDRLGPLLDPLAQAGGAEALNQLKMLQGLTIGLRNSDAGSPIPELLLTFDSKDRDALAKSLEETLAAGMAAGGQRTSWQSKDIAGTPARYFTTLLGVGVFIGKPAQGNSIVVATSERAIKDVVGSRSGTAQALKALASNNASNGAAYINFSELANVLDSAKSSLAMFTGGSSEIDKALNTEKIRKLGSTFGSIGYSNGILRFDSSLSQTPLG